MVGERCVGLRRHPGRVAGDITNANAGMSSDNEGEKPSHRKSKVSYVKLICVGLVGPEGEAEMRSRWEPG